MTTAMPDRALVLTAGLGTRMHPLSLTRAKAAVPIGDGPLIGHILRGLAGRGIRHAVLNLHHRPETITREVGDGAQLGLEVRYSWERRLLGSAGGPRRALNLIARDRFFIVNGDTIADVDLGGLADRHAESGAAVTMALVPNPAPDRYGGVTLDRHGWVRAFTRPGEDARAHHFVGTQLVEADTFAAIPDGEAAESVNGIYRPLLDEPSRGIGGVVTEARFHDVGTPGDYLTTVLSLDPTARRESLIDPESRVHPAARLVRTVVWRDVDIAADVELIDCVVGDGVRIRPGSRFENVAIAVAGTHEPRPGQRLEGDLIVAPLRSAGSSGPAPEERADES